DGFSGTSTTAEIKVHPSGRFLYGSNRGHDSIAIFSIEPRSSRLTPTWWEPTQGKTPRSFELDPAGSLLYAANPDTSNLAGLTTAGTSLRRSACALPPRRCAAPAARDPGCRRARSSRTPCSLRLGLLYQPDTGATYQFRCRTRKSLA